MKHDILKKTGEASYLSPEIEVLSIESELCFATSNAYGDYGRVPGADEDESFNF